MKTLVLLQRISAILLLLSLVGQRGHGAQRIVAVDQLGYPRTASKYVFASASADSFAVVSRGTGEKVYRGSMALWKSLDGATGLRVYRGDFSGFQQTGRYVVITSRGDTSSTFTISDSVYDPLYRMALKAFYFQRCGVALATPFAGVYQHTACHTADGFYHSSSGSTGSRVVTGGWHDAGDYGKYIVNAGITAGTLLLAYEMFPGRLVSDDIGIPESGNKTPDILDEVRYELEWVLTMQRNDGGFWFKVTREQFEGFVMPQSDTGTRYIYTISTTATGDAVAVLARAARLFIPFDSAFARICLSAAVRGWQYLSANTSIVPSGGFKNPAGTATGEYGDGNDSDERLWAAAELFETTGDATYHNYFQSALIFGTNFTGLWWGDVRSLGLLTYLRTRQSSAVGSVRSQLRQALTAYCSSQVSKRNGSGYHTVLAPGDYGWGSNSGALNAAMLLLAGAAETGDSSYIQAAADQLHYVLGVNGLSRSFVTGVGENPPRQPHHRPSAADAVPDPVPGLIAGGPDQYRDDAVLQALFTVTTPPALCYVDSLPSYASNEIAINWNAPLVFLAGYFRGVSGPTGVEQPRGEMPSEFSLDQNYPNPFNPTTIIGYSVSSPSGRDLDPLQRDGQLPGASHVKLIVYDMLGRQVATLVDEIKPPGVHVVTFNASGLASGVYLYRLHAGIYSETRKLALVR